MVDGPSPLTRAIAALRKGLIRQAGAGPTQAKAASKTPSTRSRTAKPNEKAEQTSRVAALAVRLKSISGSPVERKRKALRWFIEAVLLDEFGDSVEVNDLVQRTVCAIESDADLSTLADAALADLLPDSNV